MGSVTPYTTYRHNSFLIHAFSMFQQKKGTQFSYQNEMINVQIFFVASDHNFGIGSNRRKRKK